MRLEKFKNYFYLMRLHKPIGIFLLLWPTCWALWLAQAGYPQPKIVVIFILGVILMRSAGCIINDFADRNFDKHVARTQQRPLAAGEIQPKSSLILFVILLLLAFLLVLQLNAFTFLLAIIGLILAITYPYLKRVTHLPQLGLGIAFAWGVPMAFAAETDMIPAGGWLVFLAAAIWPIIYDTEYALVDRCDDIKIGIKSTAILFGNHVNAILAILQIIFVILLIIIGFVFQLTWPYFLSLCIVAILFFYQQKLLQRGDSKSYFKAFLNNNWVGLVIFIGILLAYVV